jgi:iron uptake system EfeUOB component EfeO/EfeM
VIRESKAMEVIHKIRKAFYKETKGRDSEYILNRIKEDSKKMQQELETTQPDPKLIVRERPRIKQFYSMEEIHQIMGRNGKYGK